jgi:hypothetical protein
MTEAILLERVLIEGRPQMRIVARIAAINEDRTEEIGEQDYFWHQARRRLGKMRRLEQRDIGEIETLLAKRIPKPIPTAVTPPARSHPIRGPHSPILQTELQERAHRAR